MAPPVRVVKPPKYLGYASKLEKNTERAEDLFKKGSGFGTKVGVGKKRPASSQQPPIEPEPRDEGPKRRPTRSTTEIPPEWIKLPVEVPYVNPASGERTMVEGVVYYSLDTMTLYKQYKGMVYVEGSINGHASILSIEEGHLPMMTEEHPEYNRSVTRLKKERKGRVDHAKRLRELQLKNEDSWHEAEVRMAELSYEADVEHLQSTMLEAAKQKLSTLKQMMEKKKPSPVTTALLPADKATTSPPEASRMTMEAEDVTTDESEGEAAAVAHATTTMVLAAVSPEEEARPCKTFESNLLSRPTILQSQAPWAPLWDKLHQPKMTSSSNNRRVAGSSRLERGRRGGGGSSREEVDYIREEDYVDMLELVRRRYGLEDY